MVVDKANGGEDTQIAAMHGSRLSGVKRIISSSYLVSDKVAELSEVEYGLIVGRNAFGKWMVKAMAAAVEAAGTRVTGGTDLAVLDIFCLHSVNHRQRPKKLANICFKLNIEDSHIVNCGFYRAFTIRLLGVQQIYN